MLDASLLRAINSNSASCLCLLSTQANSQSVVQIRHCIDMPMKNWATIIAIQAPLNPKSKVNMKRAASGMLISQYATKFRNITRFWTPRALTTPCV